MKAQGFLMQRKTEEKLHFSFVCSRLAGRRLTVFAAVLVVVAVVMVETISFMISGEEKESP